MPFPPLRREPRAFCTGWLDAIQKKPRPFYRSFSRRGEAFTYVGSIGNTLLPCCTLMPKVLLVLDVAINSSSTTTSGNFIEDHPLDTHSEPSALYCWILEILYCDPKGLRALLRVPSTVGRSVCLCWALSKPKGPKGSESDVSFCGTQ